MRMTEVNSAEEARALAIEWQQWVSEQNEDDEPTLFLSDLIEWHEYFVKLTERFPELREEFEENGII